MAKLKIVLRPSSCSPSARRTCSRGRAAAEPKPKAEVYVLDQAFFVDLDGGRAAMLRVGLLVDHVEPHGPPMPWRAPPSTHVLKGASADKLLSSGGRHQLQERIRKRIKRQTDMEIASVLFPDLTVQ